MRERPLPGDPPMSDNSARQPDRNGSCAARELVGLSSGCPEKLAMAISEARTTCLAISSEAVSLRMREDASKWPNASSMSSAMSAIMLTRRNRPAFEETKTDQPQYQPAVGVPSPHPSIALSPPDEARSAPRQRGQRMDDLFIFHMARLFDILMSMQARWR